MSHAEAGPRIALQVRCERYPVLSETFVVNEVEALAALGHDVEVLAHERGGRGDAQDRGVPVRYREDDTRGRRLTAAARLTARHPLRVLGDLLARPRWRREEEVLPLRALAPSLVALERHVHVHFAKSSALDALRAHRLLGISYSVTAHAYDIYAAPANLAEKLRSAAFATTGCAYTATELRRHADRVHVVVMGVDIGRFRRRQPHPERRTVLAVGRLVEKKGFADLVRAVADPALGGTADELRIVGDGPLRSALTAEAERLGVADRVTFVGPLEPDGVRAELEQAAVLAAPCVIAADGDRDSMPVVVKEALAMEVPVVTTDTAGLPELVRPAFGRMVPAGDPPALAAALAELLGRTAQERAAMGRAGREHVERHANLRREAARLSELFERVHGATEPLSQ